MAKQTNNHIVIALDFGTTRSGFLIANAATKQVFECSSYPGSLEPVAKTRTTLLYNIGTKQFEQWGYSTSEFLANLDLQSAKQYIEVKLFKMSLYKNKGGKHAEETHPNVEFSAIDLVSQYLKYMYQFIQAKVKELGLAGKPIKWCLTVPAIWQEKEKSLMKTAAFKAGMIESESIADDQFMIVLEPEAAAINCIKELESLQSALKDNDTFLVCDAGGGTVDITVHKFLKGQLIEMLPGDGSNCGSMYLDKQFEKWLTTTFSFPVIAHLKQNNPKAYFTIMQNWEKQKCKITSIAKPVEVPVPKALLNTTYQIGQKVPGCYHTEDGTVLIDEASLESIFSPTIQSMKQLLETMLDECKQQGIKLNYVFMAGGYGESKYLQHEISKMTSAKLIVPLSCSKAILYGAIYLGLSQDMISARTVRYNFAISIATPYDANKHKNVTKFEINGRDGYWVRTIDTLVKRGDNMQVAGQVSRDYEALADGDTSIIVSKTQNQKAVYPTDDGVETMGTIVIHDASQGEQLRVSLFFGKTTLQVQAIQLATMQQHEAQFAFE